MSQATNLAGGYAVEDIYRLNEELLKLLSDKERKVITRRYNLDNLGSATLEQIGQEYSVTRERIRQIEKNALSKMQRNISNTPLKDFHDYVAEIVDNFGGILKKDTFEQEFIPSTLSATQIGHINLNLDIHSNLDSKGNTIAYHPHLKSKGHSDKTIKEASQRLIQNLNKAGDTKEVSKLEKDLSNFISKANLSRKSLESIVEIDKRLTMVGKSRIGLSKWRHICPKTLHDKILFVMNKVEKPMHFSKIAKLIIENNFDEKKINIQAVHNELIRSQEFVLIGRGIYAMKAWGYEEGTVTDVITKILTKHKAGLSQDEIVKEVLSTRQVKPITVKLALKNNELFQRTGRKTYALKS